MIRNVSLCLVRLYVPRCRHATHDCVTVSLRLLQVLAIRHCVFIMGPAGAGKSECWRTLAAANELLHQTTVIRDLNPKAVTPDELYGSVTLSTREWKEVRRPRLRPWAVHVAMMLHLHSLFVSAAWQCAR
jgi:hypothetical protein